MALTGGEKARSCSRAGQAEQPRRQEGWSQGSTERDPRRSSRRLASPTTRAAGRHGAARPKETTRRRPSCGKEKAGAAAEAARAPAAPERQPQRLREPPAAASTTARGQVPEQMRVLQHLHADSTTPELPQDAFVRPHSQPKTPLSNDSRPQPAPTTTTNRQMEEHNKEVSRSTRLKAPRPARQPRPTPTTHT